MADDNDSEAVSKRKNNDFYSDIHLHLHPKWLKMCNLYFQMIIYHFQAIQKFDDVSVLFFLLYGQYNGSGPPYITAE